ncbi:MAG: PAS domain S-box protein [Nitrospinota bacterium]|nr:PAS domain S-box protein [Nitrospinota bacterium]
MVSSAFVNFDYSQFFESVPAYMYQVEFEGGRPVRTFHSPNCQGILGYSAEEYDQDTGLWFNMIHGLDKAEVREFLRWFHNDAVATSAEITHRIVHKNGSILWVLNKLTKTTDPDTRQTVISGVIIDVTSQKEAEIFLRRSEGKYRRLFENASDMLFTLDSEGKITSVNNATLAILGYERMELIHENIAAITNPEAALELARISAQKYSGYNHSCLIELCLRSKKGVFICVEASISVIYHNETTVEIQVIARDVTARKREIKEKNLLLSRLEERVKELSCLHKVAKILVGPHRNFDHIMNEIVELIPGGWKYPSECCAKILINGYEYKTRNYEPTQWRQSAPIVWAGGGKGMIEVCYLESKPDLDEGPFMIEERNLINSLGALLGSSVDAALAIADVESANTEMIHLIRDAEAAILHAEEAKERAEAASRLKDKFVSLVAHDLNSPFSSIIGLLKMLHEGHFERLTEQQKEIIGKVLGGCENMINMVTELLTISRLRTGLITAMPQFHDIHLITEHVLSTHALSAMQKNIVIHNDIPKDCLIFADLGLFTEALSNLVNNAVKFCRKDDTIRVRMPAGRGCCVTVTDSGIGMDQKTLTQLFRLESKISRNGTAGERGTGLGLSFVMDIMNAHSGTVIVDSRPGLGSEFTLVLPEVSPRILLLSPEPGLADSVREALAAYHVDVHNITFWPIDEDILVDWAPHLAIFDLREGDADRIKMMARFNKHSSRKTIPLLAAGAREAAVCKDVSSIGADDFIRTPFNHAELRIRVKRLLSGGQIMM